MAKKKMIVPERKKTVDQLLEEAKRSELKKLAKRANTRVRRLEKQPKEIKKDAFALIKAKQYFKQEGRTGKTKYIESASAILKMTKEEYNKEYKKVKKFLDYDTSTETGIKKVQDKRTKGLMKATGLTEGEIKTFRDFMGSELTKQIKTRLESDQLIDLYKDIKKMGLTDIINADDTSIMTNEEKRVMNQLMGIEVFEIEEVIDETLDGQEIVFGSLLNK